MKHVFVMIMLALFVCECTSAPLIDDQTLGYYSVNLPCELRFGPPDSKAPPTVHGIHAAAEKGDLDEIRKYLAAGHSPYEPVGWWKSTPLHFAATFGKVRACALLIKAGAPVNALPREGRTPLDFAILNQQPNTQKFLRSKGAMTAAELQKKE